MFFNKLHWAITGHTCGRINYEEILVITGRNKKSIEDHFDNSVELELELESKGKYELLAEVQAISEMVNIHYIRQKVLLTIVAHALLSGVAMTKYVIFFTLSENVGAVV